ncbi:mannitol dehydrogenase [Glycocaulis alkaliphilus]|uniref:Mannitol dehydrogenase n=1 Tax=Glycocaulis alkaliphilus TaxID=1434191 RepID=A0A3T0EAD8_9PROT|nr:mannitol dehydrogenase family protein [Glycocaulis alkaliphilus]AZU04126.1 mannitol dehydrogenase [Glycocaulis alkaliphilus]GGB76102.1 mannitol 2-dehydrogenase [Glycocaulis alkaliphilus]
MSARLTAATLETVPADLVRPAYDRTRLQPGIVHIGPGAFHRAHQAALVDTLLHTDPRWAITAIALRSRETTDALNVQDGLFTLKTVGLGGQTRVIGAIRRAFSAQNDPSGTLEALSAAATRLITLTITEKGYCLGTDGGLEFDHPDILHDLARPDTPRSAIGWLVAGLARRKADGALPPVIMSCDNLTDNGIRLGEAVTRLAHHNDPALAGWIERHVLFPRTMVDAITPASDPAFLDALEGELGVRDEVAVKREVFTSWVIEAADAEAIAVLGEAGAVLTRDVEGHALAKLRVLNGAHSALAWLGLALGHQRVSDAVTDEWLGRETGQLIREEILPGLSAPDGLDLDAYANGVLARFANPAISHLLSQIAWDSSQKLPVRLLGTAEGNLAAGRPVSRLGRAIAAWMRFVVRSARSGTPLTDPLAAELDVAGRAANDDPDSDTARFLSLRAVFPSALILNPLFRDAVACGYREVIALERGARP